MTAQIKTLWKRMLTETRKDVIKMILTDNEFEVTDGIYVKQTWIWQGRIPEKHKKRVLEICKNGLKAQAHETQLMIDTNE